MSNKKDNKPAPQAKPEEVAEAKRLKRTRLFLVIFAAVTVVALAVSIIIAALGSTNKDFDYMKKNLSRYVKIAEEDYKNYTVEIDNTQLGRDIKTTIMSVLYNYRTAPETDEYVKDVTISAGDEVKLYYRGYTFGENNEKNYFNGGCNFGSATPHNLVIGQGEFTEGFEFNLIGENQKDHATLEKITEGKVTDTTLVFLEYSVIYADGTSVAEQSSVIDLSDPNLDERFGQGFSAYFAGREITIGEKFGQGTDEDPALTVPTIKPTNGGAADDSYSNMIVKEAYKINATNGSVLEVEAYFADDYKEPSLQGKTAIFEVYIDSVKDYSVPEINEKFLTEDLGIVMSELEALEGDTLEKKYENYVKKQHVNAAIDEAFWAHVAEKAVVKKLPKDEVQRYYDDVVYDMEVLYPSYQTYYATFDSFARAYMGGLGPTEDWRATLAEESKKAITENIIFYYIIREEGFIPSDEEYDKIYQSGYDAAVQSILDSEQVTEESENYEEVLAAAKKTIDSYPDRYWREKIYQSYGMDEIYKLANVIYK